MKNVKTSTMQVLKDGAKKIANTSTSLSAVWIFHQKKCPSQLLKKD